MNTKRTLLKIGISLFALSSACENPAGDAFSQDDTLESSSAALTAYTIDASLEPINTATPTVFGGTINPLGKFSYSAGSSATYTITPNANSGSSVQGFDILSVTVDGVNKGAISSFTFNNLQGNHTIKAKFKTHAASTYVIKSLASASGTISPSGAITVNAGASQTYRITPASGFAIADVVVDGVSKGPVSSYTFSGVNAYHFIRASFYQPAQRATLQAESAALSGSARTSSQWPNAVGNKYVEGYYNSTTAVTKFTTPGLPFYGTFRITLRYSAGNGTSKNTGLWVNGSKVKDIVAPSTGNWSTWSTLSEDVTLRGGTNTIEFKASFSSPACINLDQIAIAPSTAPYAPVVSVNSCDYYLNLNASYGGSPYSGDDTVTMQWYLNGVALADYYYACQGSNGPSLTTILDGARGKYTLELISDLTGLASSGSLQKFQCP